MNVARIMLLSAGVALALPLAAMTIAPSASVAHAAELYVPYGPPAPVAEFVPPPPPGPPGLFIWKPGHWRWDGERYLFHHGIWERRPEHVKEWVPPHWDQTPHGWIFVEGFYR